jgi:hypothetical protein
MKLLLYSGLLYLTGVAIVMVLRPALMFRPDGTWKEFGVGRNPAYYTWLPFWLFAIIWAILSYLLVLLLAGANVLPGINATSNVPGTTPSNNGSSGNISSAPISSPLEAINEVIDLDEASPAIMKKVVRTVNEMKPGYYILNAEETARRGVPKYTYLGPEPPRLVYSGAGAPERIGSVEGN